MRAVMLMFDSLNREMLQPYGCNWTKTPNFKRLAQHSVQFNQCYAGSLPCMPARRELQTGRYNFLHRSWGPIEPFDDCMPEILKKNQVYTHLISDHIHYWEDGGSTYHYRYNSWEIIRGQEGDKWKCLPELLSPCDESILQNKDGLYFHATQNLQRHDAVNRKFIQTENDTPLAKTFQHGLEFIHTNHDCDQWFLQIECFDPHEPFFAPDHYKKIYSDNTELSNKDWPPYHQVTEDQTTIKHYRNSYAALLTMCDHYLGKLLDLFDQYDLWKDTMLIVNTDHGYLLGEHDWWSKTIMPCYDEIVHIPLFIHDPRFKKDGEVRNQIVQTIDLPATLLEYFSLPLPPHMQGKPIRHIIEHNEPIRNYALFGIHGAHINIFDGKYVYMKAPVSDANAPLYEYTTMPMHMRNLFSVEELKQAEALFEPIFPFTKGCPIWKIPKGNGNGSKDFSSLLINGKDSDEAKHIDNNSLVHSINFGNKLFDMIADPKQENELHNYKIEAYMANLLKEAMLENNSPVEQFERIGIPHSKMITEHDIEQLYKQEELNFAPEILTDYKWSRSAINTYRALMKFIPLNQHSFVITTLKEELPKRTNDHTIESTMILYMIPFVIPSEFIDMVQYFVELSSRTY